MEETSVVIIDPVTPAVVGLKSLLEDREYGFSVVGTYRDISSFRMSADRQADIILINPYVIGFSDPFAIRELLPDNPSSMVIAMSYEYIVSTALNSFDGILNIFEREQMIAGQLAVIYERLLSSRNRTDLDSLLTSREKEIMAGLYKGLNGVQIADKLCLSVHTVNFHRRKLISKTRDKSAAECAAFVLNHKLI